MIAFCKFYLHNGAMHSASTLVATRGSNVNVLDRPYGGSSLRVPKRPKPTVVTIKDSHFAELATPRPSFKVLAADSSDKRSASDFCLALILVLAAAAFLDFAAMM